METNKINDATRNIYIHPTIDRFLDSRLCQVLGYLYFFALLGTFLDGSYGEILKTPFNIFGDNLLGSLSYELFTIIFWGFCVALGLSQIFAKLPETKYYMTRAKTLSEHFNEAWKNISYYDKAVGPTKKEYYINYVFQIWALTALIIIRVYFVFENYSGDIIENWIFYKVIIPLIIFIIAVYLIAKVYIKYEDPFLKFYRYLKIIVFFNFIILLTWAVKTGFVVLFIFISGLILKLFS